jgi:hypothetical protein
MQRLCHRCLGVCTGPRLDCRDARVFALKRKVATPRHEFVRRFSGCTDCNGQHTPGARLPRGGAFVRLICEGRRGWCAAADG